MNEVPRIYDPLLVTVLVDGREITGFSPDGVITAERNEDDIFPNTGAKGDVAIAINAGNSGHVKIPLQHTSASIPFLRNLAAQRRFVPLTIADANGPDYVHITTEHAMIQKTPDAQRTKEIGSFEVNFFVPHLHFN